MKRKVGWPSAKPTPSRLNDHYFPEHTPPTEKKQILHDSVLCVGGFKMQTGRLVGNHASTVQTVM